MSVTLPSWIEDCFHVLVQLKPVPTDSVTLSTVYPTHGLFMFCPELFRGTSGAPGKRDLRGPTLNQTETPPLPSHTGAFRHFSFQPNLLNSKVFGRKLVAWVLVRGFPTMISFAVSCTWPIIEFKEILKILSSLWTNVISRSSPPLVLPHDLAVPGCHRESCVVNLQAFHKACHLGFGSLLPLKWFIYFWILHHHDNKYSVFSLFHFPKHKLGCGGRRGLIALTLIHTNSHEWILYDKE